MSSALLCLNMRQASIIIIIIIIIIITTPAATTTTTTTTIINQFTIIITFTAATTTFTTNSPPLSASLSNPPSRTPSYAHPLECAPTHTLFQAHPLLHAAGQAHILSHAAGQAHPLMCSCAGTPSTLPPPYHACMHACVQAHTAPTASLFLSCMRACRNSQLSLHSCWRPRSARLLYTQQRPPAQPMESPGRARCCSGRQVSQACVCVWGGGE